MIEMALKVMVYGFNNYWRSAQNRFDFVITVTIGHPLVFLSNKTLIFFMLMLSTKLYTAELAIYYFVGLCLILLIVDYTQWLRRLRPSFHQLNSPFLTMKNGKFSTPSWFDLLGLCYLVKLLG